MARCLGFSFMEFRKQEDIQIALPRPKGNGMGDEKDRLIGMMIEGISHITLIVQNLEQTSSFLSSVLGAKQVYDSGEETFSVSKERFFLLGGIWIAIMEGSPLSDRTYNHIAFKIPESDFEGYRQRLRAAGVDFHEGRRRVQGEGLSLYFHDYDNHLFELHTGTLEERLKAYEGKTRL